MAGMQSLWSDAEAERLVDRYAKMNKKEKKQNKK